MEFDRMGKNISSTKSVPFFLFLSLWKSLEKFLYVEHRKSNTAKFSATFFPPEKAFVPKKSNHYGEILSDPIREEARKTLENREKDEPRLSPRDTETLVALLNENSGA